MRVSRVIEPDSLQDFLRKLPNLRSFDSTKFLSNAYLQIVPEHVPKFGFLKLISKRHVKILMVLVMMVVAKANGCPKLSKVPWRRRKSIGNVGVISIINKSAQSLTNLDVGRCSLISDQALEAIGTTRIIGVLNLDRCSLITRLCLNRFLWFALRQTWPSLARWIACFSI